MLTGHGVAPFGGHARTVPGRVPTASVGCSPNSTDGIGRDRPASYGQALAEGGALLRAISMRLPRRGDIIDPQIQCSVFHLHRSRAYNVPKTKFYLAILVLIRGILRTIGFTAD